MSRRGCGCCTSSSSSSSINDCGGTKKGVRFTVSGFADCTDATGFGTCTRPWSNANGTYEFLIADGLTQTYGELIIDASGCGYSGSHDCSGRCDHFMYFGICVYFGCIELLGEYRVTIRARALGYSTAQASDWPVDPTNCIALNTRFSGIAESDSTRN